MGKKIAIVIALIGILIVGLNWSRISSFLDREGRTINNSEVKLFLLNNTTVDDVVSVLVASGVLENGEEFKAYVGQNNVDPADFASGKFVILSQTKISTLVNGLLKGENGQGDLEVKVNVVFNRCKDIYDVAGSISKCIQADSISLIECFTSQDVLNKYGFTIEQLPAIFIPRKYEFYFDTDARMFISFMAEEFKSFWTSERMAKLNTIGLKSPSQAVTLASIVYSEQSKVEEEWSVIARLYLNRISKGQKLQSDPTFKFCWGRELDGVERLMGRHRDIDCPYNTYKYEGLPPGPISITPSVVVDAVLNPADNNFTFMCAKPDYSGRHNFTSSDVQHVKNARIYQNWLKSELKKRN